MSSIDARLSKLKSRNDSYVNCSKSSELINKYREFIVVLMLSTQLLKQNKKDNVQDVPSRKGEALGDESIFGEEAKGDLNPFDSIEFDLLGKIPCPEI